MVINAIQRFDFPAARAQELQTQVRNMVASDELLDSVAAASGGNKQNRPDNWEDLELS